MKKEWKCNLNVFYVNVRRLREEYKIHSVVRVLSWKRTKKNIPV